MATAKQKAKAKVAAFRAGKGGGKFKHLSRKSVADGLDVRIDKPEKVNQGYSSLCGPSALVYQVARDQPEAYAQFAVDLYEKGRGRIGKLSVEPGSDCRNYNLPASSGMEAVDWLTLASIRDSENFFFDYQSYKDTGAGITMPGDMEDWMKAAGYQDIVEETNVYFCKDRENAQKASDLFKKGYKVSLFIAAKMLQAKGKKKKFGSVTPDHWVVLESTIKLTKKAVQLKIFTWGEHRLVPQKGTLTQDDFLDNYYGFIACKL